MIAIPMNATGPFPVIITQHGSSRDGMVFPGGGRTDEYSTRLITKGTKRGFAVVAIDAFYQSSIKPEDKRKFPNAHQYALDLKTLLVSDPRFDGANMFYTGFSYGAGQVNKSVDTLTEYNSTPWRAVAAAEPGCNIISEPVRVPFPFLLIKGSESHYYIEPCLYFAHLLRAAGVKVTLSVIDGANHFFSTNGQITKGVAVNGCRFNPVIRMKNRTLQFADGSPASRLLIRQRCITSEGGSGKNRFLLDGVIEQVLDFFVLHQSKEKVIE
ncbi:MAG: UBX domain protein [Rhodospirillaceae bacterium]|nr:UBX domain protein [Rhodospirillaceae bacterium]